MPSSYDYRQAIEAARKKRMLASQGTASQGTASQGAASPGVTPAPMILPPGTGHPPSVGPMHSFQPFTVRRARL